MQNDSNTVKCARIFPEDLPDPTVRSMDFLGSSYFKTHGLKRPLPTPDEVRALCPESHSVSPPPVRFEELGLIVKFGPWVLIDEAQCIWALKKSVQDEVPVPELYGWRLDAGQVFLYM